MHGIDLTKRFFHYDVVYSGFKFNLTDLSASIGIGGLEIEKIYQKDKLFVVLFRQFKKTSSNTTKFFYEKN